MNISRYRSAYASQKFNAKRRGIDFNLTFKQWCDFWGSDIDRRGCGHDKLQMQRVADTGPYEIGNIRKGYPKQNAATMGKMRVKRNTEKAAAEREFALDRAMYEAPEEAEDPEAPEHVYKLGFKSSYNERFNYRG